MQCGSTSVKLQSKQSCDGVNRLDLPSHLKQLEKQIKLDFVTQGNRKYWSVGSEKGHKWGGGLQSASLPPMCSFQTVAQKGETPTQPGEDGDKNLGMPMWLEFGEERNEQL